MCRAADNCQEPTSSFISSSRDETDGDGASVGEGARDGGDEIFLITDGAVKIVIITVDVRAAVVGTEGGGTVFDYHPLVA